MRTPRPSSSGQPSSRGTYFSQRSSAILDPTLQQKDFPSLPLKADTLASLTRDRPYSASAHPLDSPNRARHTRFNTDQLSYSSPHRDDSSRSVLSTRRRSIQNAQIPAHSSPLSQWQNSKRAEDVQSRAGIEDGTASTVSTTAPSTVWDELDDLKARIRKIEITGGSLPTTSNAAISTAYRERPSTAETTLTTNSISPKRRKGASSSPDASVIPEDEATGSLPLLPSAVARIKPKINPPLYKALEATARDALTLAAMTGSKNAAGLNAVASPAATADRQLRRKADNMCRSLTELCIALGDENVYSVGIMHPNGSDRHVLSSAGPASVAPSQPGTPRDPDLHASSRILSRLEARRTSLRAANSTSPQSLPDSPEPDLPLPLLTKDAASRPGGPERSNSVIRRRGPDLESPVSQRPLSRAATDAGHRPRKSREYTSDHPLPLTKETRKSYFPTSGQSTPTNGASMNTARLAEARERRLASMGYGSSPSTALSHRRLQQVGTEGG